METIGLLSLLPPVAAIALALVTRRVILSLGAGLVLGYIILAGGNPITGISDTALALLDVFKSAGNRRIILFTLLVGALIALTQRSGGVAGFVDWLTLKMERQSEKGQTKTVQLLALLTGTVLFIESNISILTVGTVYRPVFDRLNIPREKLAYITDSSSAPSCILFPFNAWGAYIAGLLAAQSIENPFGMVLSTIGYNVYPIFALLILLFVILSGKDIGPMRRAHERGSLLRDDAKPMMGDAATQASPPGGAPRRARNMLIPIGVMVFMMPALLILTGWAESGGSIIGAIQSGSGSFAVLWAVISGLAAALILIAAQKLLSPKDVLKQSLAAMTAMIPLAALMMLAFALGTMCKALGTGAYTAQLTEPFLSAALLPVIVFLTACFIAFSTGTSWGTFAIMIIIAVPLARELDANMALCIAAALGGGVFGDHCSPTSDTSIITSMATANDHIDHVRTQLPYALIGGALAAMTYLVLGVMQG